MSKYRAVFRTSFLNSLAYRVNFLLWGFNELIDTLVFLFVWIFIFGERQSIGGFTLPQTVTYMIGVGMINTIISSNIGRNLSRLTKGGGLSNLLVKPVNVPLSLFIKNFAWRPLTIVIRFLVYLVVAFFFRDKFIFANQPIFLLLFTISLLLAFVINNLFDFCFGCLAFWTTETEGSLGILRTVKAFFSGGYAPLTFFPFFLQTFAYFLPFAYTRYFPMLIYLQKISLQKAVYGVLLQFFWVGLLLFLSKLLWRKGIKNYEGVGI